MAVSFKSNLGAILDASDEAIKRAAEVIGGTAESYAKERCPTKTGNLKNSITHSIHRKGRLIVIGSRVKYAVFVEMGTGKYATGGSRAKVIPWRYKDEDGKWHTTSGRKATPFMRPAIEEHIDEYKAILEQTLKG